MILATSIRNPNIDLLKTYARRWQAEGIAAAKKRGVKFGRPIKEAPPEFEEIVMKWQKKELQLDAILKEYCMCVSTFYRRLRELLLLKGQKK